MEHGLWGLLNKGADEAAQRGEDLVRLRCECIVQAVYYLTLTLMFIVNGMGLLYVPMSLALAIQIVVLIRSYKTKGSINRVVFTVCMAASSILLSTCFGVDLGFQYFLYVAILLTLLDSHISYGTKILCCVVAIILAITFHAVNLLHGMPFALDAPAMVLNRLRMWNEVALAFNIVIIGLSYTKHQVEAERQLYLANQKLKLAADTDQLTRLPNRRAILEVLKEIEESNTGTISIAMGDIDHFKMVNDTYGHDAGDEVLKTVSNEIMRFMEKRGYCARWGGEEFLLVFTDMNGDDAYYSLDSFRRKLAEKETEYEGSIIKVTMTFGLEEHGFYQNTDKTIKDADDKLYTGKETGRNKVVY